MKKSLVLSAVVIVLAAGSIFAFVQQDKAKRPSPPATATANISGTEVSVNYNQPAKKGREIFGKLVPYGEVWRTGANEATEVSFSKDVTIAGKALKAGKYTLFTIPNKDKWTIIFNSKLGQWGSYAYKAADDVLRVDVSATQGSSTVEQFTISLEASGKTGTMTLAWDMTKVAVPIAAN